MKKFKHKIQTLTCCALLFGFGVNMHKAEAQLLIVDQSNLVGGLTTLGTLIPGQSLGQSFKPSLTGIDWFRIQGSSVGVSTVRLSLLSGTNMAGISLATTTPIQVTNATLQPIEFRFLSTVSLNPGAFYTARIDLLSGDSYKLEFSFANPYSRGFAFDESYTAVPLVDLVFSEGLVSVPEPSVVTIMLGSFLVFTLKRNRSV